MIVGGGEVVVGLPDDVLVGLPDVAGLALAITNRPVNNAKVANDLMFGCSRSHSNAAARQNDGRALNELI